ncbi:MAG TPA: hypothetical protein VNS09_20560 [Solirubrobacter sp.]|nr:hypothetical protein [Solirubrobacter sp.]
MLIDALSLAAGIALAVYAMDVIRTREPAPPPPPAPSERPGQVAEIERALALAGRAGDLHLHLRPILREIAQEREALDKPMALGDDLWELVRPDRPPPLDPFAPGATPAQIDAMLDRLEAL